MMFNHPNLQQNLHYAFSTKHEIVELYTFSTEMNLKIKKYDIHNNYYGVMEGNSSVINELFGEQSLIRITDPQITYHELMDSKLCMKINIKGFNSGPSAAYAKG